LFQFHTFQLLAYITNARAELVRPFTKLRVVGEQVTVGRQHGSAATGVGDDWKIAGTLECLNIPASQGPGAFEISRMCVKSATTHLAFWGITFKSVNAKNARRGLVNPRE
jgi:hypothetical protein